MKKILFVALLAVLGTSESQAALSLKCNLTQEDGAYDEPYYDKMLFVMGGENLHCVDRAGNRYTVTMGGVGVGFHGSSVEVATIKCPTVSKRRLKRKGKVVLGLVHADVAVFGGVDAGIAINHRGGMCLMGGAEWLALGADATVGEMWITPDGSDQEVGAFVKFTSNFGAETERE